MINRTVNDMDVWKMEDGEHESDGKNQGGIHENNRKITV